MKQIIFKLICFTLLLACNFVEIHADTQSEDKTLSFLIKGRGVNLDFYSPSLFSVSTGYSETTIETITDFTYIGGVMVGFSLTLDDTDSASKIIVRTTRGYESEHPIINGHADVQTFVPVASTSGQQIYLIVE